MEKTRAAEKNRTIDNMWVKRKKKKKGGSTQNRKEPYDVPKRTWLWRKGVTDQQTVNVPSTSQGHLRTLLKNKNKIKSGGGKKEKY